MSEQSDVVEIYFPTEVYVVDKPQYLTVVDAVSQEYMQTAECNLYGCMTANYHSDARLKEFATYAAQTAWDFLDSQGYAMEHMQVDIMDMWTQQHNKHSDMPQHVHTNGIQLTAFYFLNSSANGSRLVIHDPRPGKNQINLPAKNTVAVTSAHTTVNFEPRPGRFIFINSWLPHSFSKNTDDEPTKFVHVNFVVTPLVHAAQDCEVEII
jgi:hypothetical protein